KGVVLSGVVQEIDIPSGRVLFEWSSIDHVPVTDTVVSFTGGTSKVPFDYFHINSISIAPDGTLLISARNTSPVYKIARPSRVLIGWGNLPYFSEFTANGTLVLDGHYPGGDQTYRILSGAWTGQPTDQPAAAARPGPAGGSVVYASWNGATQVATWTVLAGASP